ncbi:hypothetical protein BpHYR1_007078 [Brachionus plicatilis]|uniref:Uncharacterized protein n=1 Tax=Brachionus plicatilis TaxID=10195 RepID=A0A3M7PL23_BRAPC|nr:hypothetical protein BpHYR1_007078 [Brachionus plicatilis]
MAYQYHYICINDFMFILRLSLVEPLLKNKNELRLSMIIKRNLNEISKNFLITKSTISFENIFKYLTTARNLRRSLTRKTTMIAIYTVSILNRSTRHIYPFILINRLNSLNTITKITKNPQLIKISDTGPSTLSNRCLSSLTHFKGPLAITVAARGLSKSRAISPK